MSQSGSDQKETGRPSIMSAIATSPIRFEVWDYCTIDGGGYIVIRRPGCCNHRFGAHKSPGVFTTTARVAGYSVEAIEANYRARWSVPVDVRYCACGCLRGTNAADRPIYRDGQPVTYHGSLTELHGLAYYYGPCFCRSEDCSGFELETPLGQIINHVGYDSFSPR